MRTGGNSALTVRGACFAAGLAFSLATANADGPVQIAIGDDSVSILAQDTSIRSVLEELSLHSSLVLVSQDTLDELVTVDIDEPTLPEAIRRLLRQKSFMLHQVGHNAGNEIPGNPSYTKLWIWSSELNDGQQSWRTQASSSQTVANESELVAYQILATSSKSGDREDAMASFSDFGSESVLEHLQRGLFDVDEKVREAAIESLVELGGTESVRALSLVLNDPDAGIRIDAVDALGEIGGMEAIELLEGAMADENHTVREVAAEWITELNWQRE